MCFCRSRITFMYSDWLSTGFTSALFFFVFRLRRNAHYLFEKLFCLSESFSRKAYVISNYTNYVLGLKEKTVSKINLILSECCICFAPGIVTKVTKKPGRLFVMKILQFRKTFFVIESKGSSATHSHQAFEGGLLKFIRVIIEQTKNVEPVCPIQHFNFEIFYICYRKCVFILQNKLPFCELILKIIVILKTAATTSAGTIIKETKLFKIIVEF